MVRDDDEILRNVACCTALILYCLNNTEGSLPVEGESNAANAGSSGPEGALRGESIDFGGSTVD